MLLENGLERIRATSHDRRRFIPFRAVAFEEADHVGLAHHRCEAQRTLAEPVGLVRELRIGFHESGCRINFPFTDGLKNVDFGIGWPEAGERIV